MPFIGALVGAGASLLGSSMSSRSQQKAANTSARAQVEAARIGAEEARFRPVGTTTRFGSSQFMFGPEGRLSGASYTVDPRIAAYQDRLQALAEQQLGEAEMASGRYRPLQEAGQSLFNLGSQYLAETPEQVAERYMARQMDLLAPGRERQYAQLQNQLYQTGRGGLAVGGTGARPSGAAGLGAANPELEAYYNALAQQDAQLAAQAQQAGQQQLAFGTGLFGQGAGLMGGYEAGVTGAINPFTTMLGGVSTLESLGQQPLDIGAQLGGRAATAGGNAGQMLFQAGQNAALTRQQVAQQNPLATSLISLGSNPQFQQLGSQVGNFVGGLFGGGAPSSALPYASQQGIGGSGGVPYMLPSIWNQ
jgi:hypothetical protein